MPVPIFPFFHFCQRVSGDALRQRVLNKEGAICRKPTNKPDPPSTVNEISYEQAVRESKENPEPEPKAAPEAFDKEFAEIMKATRRRSGDQRRHSFEKPFPGWKWGWNSEFQT